MKSKLTAIVVLVVILAMSLVVVGQAVAGSNVDAIIEDAKDGTLDGNWSAADIQAALNYLKNNPILTQYSDMQSVLEDYVGSSQAPGVQGSQGGQLAFTGSEVLVVFAAGAGLIGSGVFLRRRARVRG